jgi:hypothetical protein
MMRVNREEGVIMNNEFNFIHPDMSEKDMKSFGFWDDKDSACHIEENWILAHIMHRVGMFPSVGIARKNGWNKPIPEGFSEFTVGKMKKKVWILNEINDL